MTPQQAIAENGCVACLSDGEKESIITLMSLRWLEWLQIHGAPGTITDTPQQALYDNKCVPCLGAGEALTIRTIAALVKLQWLEDNP